MDNETNELGMYAVVNNTTPYTLHDTSRAGRRSHKVSGIEYAKIYGEIPKATKDRLLIAISPAGKHCSKTQVEVIAEALDAYLA